MIKLLPLLTLIAAGVVWLAWKVFGSFVKAAFLASVTVHVEHHIPAPPAEVWAVLIDRAAYAEWNRINPHVYGTFEVGNSIITKVFKRHGPPMIKSTTVVSMIAGKEIVQAGGSGGSLSYKHQWILKPVDGGTLLTHHEVFRGYKVSTWDEEDFEPGYQRFMQALGHRVISLQSTTATQPIDTQEPHSVR